MSVANRRENVNAKGRKFTEYFASVPTTTSSRPAGLEAGRTDNDWISDRSTVARNEDVVPNSPSSHTRLTSFPEVVEAVMERPHTEAKSPSEAGTVLPPRLEAVQLDGKRVWAEFNRQSQDLQRDLQVFKDAVQGLGSSLDIAQSARKLSESLSFMTWLFGENARNLFPHVIHQIESPQIDIERNPDVPRKRTWPPVSASQSKDKLFKTIRIYDSLEVTARNIKLLRDALEPFPEFENFEKWTLKCFEGDLEYWSTCLQQYEDRIESHEVRVYVHDLSQELGQRLSEVGDCIKKYIASVPTVRLSQKHALSNLQTLATIATFFSAVTASTLNFSITNSNTSIAAQIVNTLWFSSLVFSIASALNSSIAFTWKSAIYSSPYTRLNGWLWVWMRQSPMLFLLMSIVSFLAGLGCFVISSQSHLIWIVVVICECISSVSVGGLLVWVAADRWTFYRLQKQQQSPGSLFNHLFGVKPANMLPTHLENTESWSLGYISRSVQPVTSVSLPSRPFFTSHIMRKLPSIVHPHADGTQEGLGMSPARQRWKKALNLALRISEASRLERESKDILDPEYMGQLQDSLLTVRVSGIPILHEAGSGTSGIQFDPTGRYLAVCGKRLTMCHDVKSNNTKPLLLPHYIGLARQVIWTPCGKYIVIRTHRAVHIWTMSPIPDRRICIRYEISHFIMGIPLREENAPSRFVSIEGSNMNKLVIIDVHGEEHRHPYNFEGFSIQHVDVASDTPYLLLAGEASESPGGLKPIRASPTRKLIAFNLETFQVEHEVPLWHDVRHVTFSGKGHMAIVTYNGGLPPQLWMLRVTLAGIRLILERQFATAKAVQMSEKQVNYSGKAHFLNKDRFVLCTTNDGDIHIWRRDLAEPVHVLNHLAANEKDKPLEVTCNPTSVDFMFATRSRDGTIRIWKAHETSLRESGKNEHLHLGDVFGHRASINESPTLEPRLLEKDHGT